MQGLQPCTCRSNVNSRSGPSVGWRGGSGCRGRRKPIPGGLAAASMPRTPLQPDPPRFPLFSAICRNSSWGQIRFPKENGSDPHLFRYPTDVPTNGRHPPTVAGICQRRGGVGGQDRWRHGWRHRAPMGEGASLAKHCFASARTHSRQRLGRTPEGGLRRVLTTHTAPPSHGMRLLILLRLRLRQVQAASPAENSLGRRMRP